LNIGGGIAGLTAGVYARSCGYEVDVLEQHTIPGGLATSWSRDGYPHWFLGSRRGPAGYTAEKSRIAEAVIAILERRMVGVRRSIEVTDVSTPASAIHFTGNWKGRMEGFLPTPGTGFSTRRQALPRLRRFLMVGQWVQPGGGLPAGLMTARTAVQTMCRQDARPFTPIVASPPSNIALASSGA
jgi:phytoene dehydrogenase-like protein